jgi:hypothetical protein
MHRNTTEGWKSSRFGFWRDVEPNKRIRLARVVAKRGSWVESKTERVKCRTSQCEGVDNDLTLSDITTKMQLFVPYHADKTQDCFQVPLCPRVLLNLLSHQQKVLPLLTTRLQETFVVILKCMKIFPLSDW